MIQHAQVVARVDVHLLTRCTGSLATDIIYIFQMGERGRAQAAAASASELIYKMFKGGVKALDMGTIAAHRDGET